MMAREKLVIIGAGMAATRLVEELRAQAPDRYSICIVGEEPRPPYNRVLLSPALAGEIDLADLALKPAPWWRAAGVDLISGRKAVAIDARSRRVALDDGAGLSYDALVLATGARALRLPLPGAGLAGVYTFRDVADVEAMTRLGAAGARVLVIGGGLLGLEAAYGLMRRGARVTLAHVMDRLMERQLDYEGAALLRRLVEEKGVRVLLDASATHLHGDRRVRQVAFADGSRRDVDAVIFAVGVRPETALAATAGLAVGRGVIVNDALATSDPHIFALGDCAEHAGQCYGLIEPAYEQARVLAARLAGRAASYRGSVVATNLKVSGVRVFSAGDVMGAGATMLRDPRMGVYRKLVIDGDRLTGAILMGDVAGASDCLAFIRSGESVAAARDALIFGLPLEKEAA